jgi:hypothetical protein
MTTPDTSTGPTSASLPLARRRGRRWLFAAGLAAVIVGGQELAFRLIFPLPEVSGFNRAAYQPMDGTNPAFRKSKRRGLAYDRLLLESAPDGYSEIHRLNLYGFRTRDFAIDPPRDRRRIVLIGDSMTEGQGAPESGTIAAHWERLLARDGTPAEMINLGVIAASLSDLTLLARDAIPLLRPSDVVLVIFANDLPAPPYPTMLDEAGPRHQRRDTPWWTPRVAELIGRVATDQPIYRRWPHVPVRVFAPVPDPANPWTGRGAPPPGLDPALFRAMAAGTLNPWLREQAGEIVGMLAHEYTARELPHRYVFRVAQLCRSSGSNLVVAYIPFYGVTSPRYAPALAKFGLPPATAAALSLDPIYHRQNDLLAQLCRGFDLSLADTTEALTRAEAAGIPQFWEYDSHPRPAGYATIARVIHEVWRRAIAPPPSKAPAVP